MKLGVFIGRCDRVTKFSGILEKSSEKRKMCIQSVRGSDLSIVARDIVLVFLKIPENFVNLSEIPEVSNRNN
jgi:hypothetical protein